MHRLVFFVFFLTAESRVKIWCQLNAIKSLSGFISCRPFKDIASVVVDSFYC